MPTTSCPAPQPICIVEPDTAVRDGLNSFIQLYSPGVRTFASGRALQRAWPNLCAAGVLCAAQLPDVSGVELYQWLNSRGFDKPFALTVSKHQHQLINQATQAGIFHILHKPLLPGTALIRFIDHSSSYTTNEKQR